MGYFLETLKEFFSSHILFVVLLPLILLMFSNLNKSISSSITMNASRKSSISIAKLIRLLHRNNATEKLSEPRNTISNSPPDADPVDAAVFCEHIFREECHHLVQVFIYSPGRAHVARLQAMEADPLTRKAGTFSLALDVPIKTKIQIHLEMPGIKIDRPDAEITWLGREISVQFGAWVIPGKKIENVIGRVAFSIMGVPAGDLRFKVLVTKEMSSARLWHYDAKTTRYQRAFASYSSEDRSEVLRRVQAFRIAGLSVFQDVLDFDPGDRWERELWREIDKCDVFLLFWSSAAARSPWVAKEIAYALSRQAGDLEAAPAIQPVPIEGPPPVPPPESLRHLHFNDALLVHIQASSRPRA